MTRARDPLVKKLRDGWYYRRGSNPSYPWIGPFQTQHVAEKVRESVTGGPWGTAKPDRSHATKSKTGDKTTDKTDIAALASMFGLPDWDRIDEMNQQHYWEMARGAEGEEAQQEAEREAQDEVYAKWYDAVEHAASKLFEEHGLELQPAGKWHPSTYAKTKAERRPFQLKIVPSTSWKDAAEKIRETINGVGDFHFGDLGEFLRSGPYTARQAVLSHLGYIKRYPAVYGGQGAHQMYEQHWR
jgi:hypothetical protein